MALADVSRDDQDLPRLGLRVGLTSRNDSRRVALRRLRLVIESPFDVAADTLGERCRRGPLELALGAPAAHDLAVEVAGAGLRVDDLDVPHQLLDALRDLPDRDVLRACEVVDAVARDIAEAGRDPVGEILDVHEPP